MKIPGKKISIIALAMLLTGCGFHLRNAENFPLPLRRLNFTSYHVNNAITAELTRKLRAAQVDLTQNAPLHLYLNHSKTYTDLPVIFDSSLATTYSYYLHVNVKLTEQHHTILDTQVTATASVIHNVNQVSAAVFTPLMRRTLTRELVDRIYNLLISRDTLQKIHAVKAKGDIHVDHSSV